MVSFPSPSSWSQAPCLGRGRATSTDRGDGAEPGLPADWVSAWPGTRLPVPTSSCLISLSLRPPAPHRHMPVQNLRDLLIPS